MTLAQEVGAQLRTLRRNAGINQTVVATALGVTQYYVSKIEDGKAPLALEQWCPLYAAVLGHELKLSFSLVPADGVALPQGSQQK